MKYKVRCYHCDPAGQFIADCPSLMDAQEIAKRHESIRKPERGVPHKADIALILDTPHEGLLQ